MPIEVPSIRTFDALQSHAPSTLQRALALLRPAVIEIPIDDRETLPLVQPMRLRAVD